MVDVCTACSRRFFPSQLGGSDRCDKCLAHEFEAELAREILRATAHMPPRHVEPRPTEMRKLQ